ncbi:MAG: phosphoribosyl-ATP diphosphatase [Rhodospirillaceae bacterium]
MAKQTKSTDQKKAASRKAAPKKAEKAKPRRRAQAKPAPKGHVVEELFEVVKKRRRASPDSSYTARLYGRGRAQIAKKVGEEAVEVAIAALVQDRKALVSESCDLLFHLLVLWADVGVKPEQAWRELERRFGTSGITEKRQRRS